MRRSFFETDTYRLLEAVVILLLSPILLPLDWIHYKMRNR